MAATQASHAIILAASVLCLLATFAGIVSVAVQGWTIAPAARLLRLQADPPSPDTAH